MGDYTVTAHMAEPIVNWSPSMMLDGPLSYGAFRRHQRPNRKTGNLPRLTDGYAYDFPLPLGTWDCDPVGGEHPTLLNHDGRLWGWRTSAVITEDAVATSGVDVRRRPATNQMIRWSQAKRHDIGAGPLKARNVRLPAAFAHRLSWNIQSDSPDAVMRLLSYVTHLGRLKGHGHGRIITWTIADGPENGWLERPMPYAGGQRMGVRAPHWHPTRQVPCSW